MSTKLAKIAADFSTQLAAKMLAGATTGTLQSVTDDDGVALANGVYYFTIDGNNSNKEYIQATITGTAMASVKSVTRQGTISSGTVREHRAGALVELTDFANLKFLTNLFTGTDDLDATTPLEYDAAPTLTPGSNQLSTVAYSESLANQGAATSSTSTKGIIKVSTAPVDANNPIAVGDNDARVPTTGENDALAGGGTFGTPSTSNKYITQDYLGYAGTSGGNDQSQTTQDAVVEVGEADATTKKNILAQSFTAAKTEISGVKLYKTADTGTFTGDVVITLQADTAGYPSGTPLATVTLNNATWLNLPVGEFIALFTTEYTSLTIGSLYWIVIDPSTSDNANHPNLGTNSAGGYGSGSAKYKNVTDSWVAISTIDLYFKTLEGFASQYVKTGTDGKIDAQLIGTSKKIFLSTTEVTFTNGDGGGGAGVEKTIFQTTIPAGTLGTNNGIKFKIFITNGNIRQTAASWVIKVKYGGTTQLTANSIASANDLTNVAGFIEGFLLGDGNTSVQKMTVQGTFYDTDANTAESDNDAVVGMDKQVMLANAAGAIDSTVDQPLTITLTQTNDAANDCLVEWCVIESIR